MIMLGKRLNAGEGLFFHYISQAKIITLFFMWHPVDLTMLTLVEARQKQMQLYLNEIFGF